MEVELELLPCQLPAQDAIVSAQVVKQELWLFGKRGNYQLDYEGFKRANAEHAERAFKAAGPVRPPVAGSSAVSEREGDFFD